MNGNLAEKDNSDRGWKARLVMDFQKSKQHTVVRQQERLGPLCIQRPFYPENDVCHLYLLHPPGGVVGGDELEVILNMKQASNALVTTPAANKIYRSNGLISKIAQQFNVAANAHLEWLPQETILFGGSRLNTQTTIHLDRNAGYLGWETYILGRPRSGDQYSDGSLNQKTAIYIDNEPRLLEHQHWDTNDPIFEQPWGLAGKRILATCHIYPGNNDLLKLVRKLISQSEVDLCAATLVDEVLVIRALENSSIVLRNTFEHLWSAIRQPLFGIPPCPPRIWAT